MVKWRVAFTFISLGERISHTLACNKISAYLFLERNRHAEAFSRLMEDIQIFTNLVEVVQKSRCSVSAQNLFFGEKKMYLIRKFTTNILQISRGSTVLLSNWRLLLNVQPILLFCWDKLK